MLSFRSLPTEKARCLVLLLLIGGVLVLVPSTAQAACSNEAFRGGLSADLPDCRAYELVSPPGSDGRELGTPIAAQPVNMFATELVNPEGSSVLFITNDNALEEPGEASGVIDVYEAVRSNSGWETIRHLSPNGAQATFPNAGGASSNHQYTFVEVSEGSLAMGGLPTDYLGRPDGSFQLVGIGSQGAEQFAQGRYISPDGTHVIFSTGGEWCPLGSGCPNLQLEPNAAPTGTIAVYDRSPDGPTKVISLLPGDVPPTAGEDALYQGVSRDADVVAFKIAGTLYVRVNNEKTLEVEEGDPTFAGISGDGSFVFYVESGNVYSFNVANGETTEVTGAGNAELVNISADGSHVYFLSQSLLDGSKGAEGQPNLYVWDRGLGAIHFVATVLPSDREGLPALNNWTSWAVNPSKQAPGGDSSRSTPDGKVLLFQSKAQLTGYENLEHTEIYRYEAETNDLQCVSCSPQNLPPVSNARLQSPELAFRPEAGEAAAVIHNLSDDGSRAFFETSDSLVPRDFDGLNDVYEWTPGPGPQLISTGDSIHYSDPAFPFITYPEPNTLLGINPTGRDVVFVAQGALTPEAAQGGAPAIYDAREGGGFPSPSLGCGGTSACNAGLGAKPSLTSAGSNRLAGKGNVKAKRHKCRRHKRRPHKGSKRAKARGRLCQKHQGKRTNKGGR